MGLRLWFGSRPRKDGYIYYIYSSLTASSGQEAKSKSSLDMEATNFSCLRAKKRKFMSCCFQNQHINLAANKAIFEKRFRSLSKMSCKLWQHEEEPSIMHVLGKGQTFVIWRLTILQSTLLIFLLFYAKFALKFGSYWGC